VIYYKSDKALAQQIISGIKSAYELRDIGDIKWFLGVHVIRDRAVKKLWLAYNIYIEKMATKF
jgi:hypothetical protein